MLIRVGIPASFERFGETAAAAGAPVLVSANAMWRRDHFSVPASVMSLDDVALDSAGFVAMLRYGGYRWTVAQYVELAALRRWAWWASMDWCCEREVAQDGAEVRRRQILTIEALDRCRRAAAEHGIPGPMPVLQGWAGDDYRWCAEQIGPLPDLVGIGSVCRRELGGPDGLLAIVRALGRSLEPHVRFHLFGAKGTAIQALAGHPRIGSIDSMAWDFASRVEKKRNGQASSTIAYRQDYLARWYRRQRDGLGLFAAEGL